ncbi:MAG: glycosyltransferase [Acidobacteria bacterium]|nr:glycosyltransferase [Acidobacteriota bacterium]
MRSLAVLSLHTSPLAQPGTGDSGGMNVYVRELAGALAQAGVRTEVFVRRWAEDLPDVVDVEPGFRVVHIDAGPVDLAKEQLPSVVDTFADGVAARLSRTRDTDAIHANYWLSGVAGHRLKHELSLPLVSTFHTLARVKADTGDDEPEARIAAETSVIGCSDAILANCAAEVTQLVELYGADPTRIEIVPPGVDHAFFSPGNRAGARAALGLGDHPVLLFAGRIQPLKGLTVAVAAFAELAEVHPDAVLVVVGGPSGTDGAGELRAARSLIEACGLQDRVRFVPPQPHHMLSTYFRAADVCVVPSRSESFGLVALEAAACGTPVVAAAVGGLRTLVDDGRTGVLIDSRDPAQYAAAISELLSSPERAAAMAATAAEKSRYFTWSTTAARLRRIYADLTSRALVSCS